MILEKFPFDITYYAVQKNCEPDWDNVEDLCKKEHPDAMVLVHYFGFPNNLAVAKKFCDTHDIALIEDCAHVLTPYGQVGTTGSLRVFSPWKLLPLPELGLLSAASTLTPFFVSYPAVSLPFTLLRWYTKREIQRLLCAVGVNWYRRRVVESSALDSHDINPDRCSIRLFHYYKNILESVRAHRMQNYRILESFFKERFFERFLFPELPEGTVPYCFPYLTREPAAEVSRVLIRRGIPAFPWPTLPLKVRKDKERHERAHWLAEHMLLLPVHQNVSVRQIEYMKRILSDQRIYL